jgi:hypothetical protein
LLNDFVLEVINKVKEVSFFLSAWCSSLLIHGCS